MADKIDVLAKQVVGHCEAGASQRQERLHRNLFQIGSVGSEVEFTHGYT